jgi:hypothetical protein
MHKTPETKSRAKLTAGAALLLCGLIALIVAAVAPGKGAEVIGKLGGKAPPSCPTPKKPAKKPQKVCQALATVTGFQMVGNGKRAAMKVPQDGKLVAWSIDLSTPSASEQNSFTSTFDLGAPTARIAILKPKSKSDFKLAKQTPKVNLDHVLGTKPVFTLKSPLRIKKGTVIAISTASWVPNLAHEGELTANGDKWRASRSRKKCGDDPNKSDAENREDLLSGKPQKKVGTTRTYGCTYNSSRILYQAYYVPGK